MSRTKRDILDTESMLQRLTKLLQDHSAARDLEPGHGFWTRPRLDAESLRRISMTLHRWHELECNGNVARGHKKNGGFEWDESGATYWVSTQDGTPRWKIPDRETGARKRLASILKRYPGLTAYVQGDPRGCALYILRPGDVRDGMTVDSCYTNGLAVFQ